MSDPIGDTPARTSSDSADLRRFTRQVLTDLERLAELLAAGRIERDRRRLGAEQEVFLVDRSWQPAPAVSEILAKLDDPRYTTELARFNLEINLDPLHLTGDCFRRLETDLERHLDRVRAAAHELDLEVVLTGILPTLLMGHLDLDNLTPEPRYSALNEATKRLRGEEWAVRFRGIEELNIEHTNVLLEACNTSFQVHIQVAAEDFAQFYNAAQMVAGPVLAVAANSPLLFGRRLWAETRIPLFQQSVDTRSVVPPSRRQIPRVSFGSHWVEDSVLEIYREDVGRFPPVMTLDREAEHASGDDPPRLAALTQHNSTVYRWNRPCYGISEGEPHLRIENRYLPSGPTLTDEIANAALWCGAVRGLATREGDIAGTFPFEQAWGNFVRAAREGLEVELDWGEQTALGARDLLGSFLLPLAREGLEELGVEASDADRYLGVIERRVATRRTGARWLLEAAGALGERTPRPHQLAALTRAMRQREASGDPVADWAPVTAAEMRPENGELLVRDLMRPDPFAVREEDAHDLAACLMDWRHIRHVPVEDDRHRFVGLVTYRSLLRRIAGRSPTERDDPIPIRSVMLEDVVTTDPDQPAREALELMLERGVGCLPVVEEGHLVGVLSERDFLGVAAEALGKADDDE